MDKIDELLTRGVANIIPSRTVVEKALRSEKKLNVFCGFDVTASHLHIGNAVPMRKLQQFIDLGHHVTFLIGDFTTLVGDTSDKETERPIIPEEEIEKNWQLFAPQAGKVIDFSKVNVVRNSQWLSKLTFKEVVRLMQRFSLNDFISRELIKKRLVQGKSINLSEVIYPIMQGYDSYFMDTDIQVGATDQTFNMQAGRSLQKQLRNKESFVITFDFLTGTDGRKMSKSWGNAIWLDDEAINMFGKVMAIRDDLIDEYFLLATNLPQDKFPKDKHPMGKKKKLSWQIVSELHSAKAADQAQHQFESTFQEGELPQDIPVYHLEAQRSVVNILVTTQLAKSKSEARRLVEQGGVRINQSVITNSQQQVGSGDVIQVGPRKIVKLAN